MSLNLRASSETATLAPALYAPRHSVTHSKKLILQSAVNSKQAAYLKSRPKTQKLKSVLVPPAVKVQFPGDKISFFFFPVVLFFSLFFLSLF